VKHTKPRFHPFAIRRLVWHDPRAHVFRAVQTGMTKLSWDQVLAFRVDHQFLHSRAPAGSMLEVASAMCVIRAQL